MLKHKKILLGVGGGIAVYRVAELARMLSKAGADVRCLLTRSACEFVTPMTFEALTGNQAHTELFDLTSERDNPAGQLDWTGDDRRTAGRGRIAEHQMGHIMLARWADAAIIAPATANLMARIAHGIADDLLTTLMQVCEKPVLLAPAMNTSMWKSDATQRNLEILEQRGMKKVGPDEGKLACGEQGAGKLAELHAIYAALLPLITKPLLQGQHWVINAGPTVEAWDSVRVLTNRASGRLGAILADHAAILGAKVSLIAGPGTPETRPDIHRTDIESADQMQTACEQAACHADIFIGTAAVSDFRFAHPQTEKLKRGDTSGMRVELTANPDMIARIATMHARPEKVIAFAAESSDHIAYAREKMQKKHVDAIVANDISNMGSDRACGWWVTRHDEQIIGTNSKSEFAEQIIKHIMEMNT